MFRKYNIAILNTKDTIKSKLHEWKGNNLLNPLNLRDKDLQILAPFRWCHAIFCLEATTHVPCVSEAALRSCGGDGE